MGNCKEMKKNMGILVYNTNRCINFMCPITRLDKLLLLVGYVFYGLFGGKEKVGMEEKIEN
jgi:hypothetical protein